MLPLRQSQPAKRSHDYAVRASRRCSLLSTSRLDSDRRRLSTPSRRRVSPLPRWDRRQFACRSGCASLHQGGEGSSATKAFAEAEEFHDADRVWPDAVRICTKVSWRGNLPNAFFDEFVLRVRMPNAADRLSGSPSCRNAGAVKSAARLNARPSGRPWICYGCQPTPCGCYRGRRLVCSGCCRSPRRFMSTT